MLTRAASTVDISAILETDLSELLLYPGERALSRIVGLIGVAPREIGALTASQHELPIDLTNVFRDLLGQFVTVEFERACALLPTYDAGIMDALHRSLDADYFRKYFRQSTTRVLHLIEMLHEYGLTGGRVLEVGSLFGTFAGPLQRRGYVVTAIDRYAHFGGALDGFLGDLLASGVTVIEATREDEDARLAELGQYDAVIAMAVIEHIPHTPRFFLDALKKHVKPDGLLVLDTPNIARYWNRRRLCHGESIHQPIELQFHSDIPYEGHHREYTLGELRWMLGELGLSDIRSMAFDYNMLQFPIISREHIDALLEMIIDPSKTDTLLIGGRCHE